MSDLSRKIDNLRSRSDFIHCQILIDKKITLSQHYTHKIRKTIIMVMMSDTLYTSTCMLHSHFPLQERDKALEEVGSLKKENTSLSSKVTVLTSDLSTLKDTHSKLEVESRQIEGHRDMLLDKVERLHADNHKLEDR